MNTYKINYNQLRQQPEISEMLTALERGLAKFKVNFYLVGAVARDVWMNAIKSKTVLKSDSRVFYETPNCFTNCFTTIL